MDPPHCRELERDGVTPADLRLTRSAMLWLYAMFKERGEARAAEACIAAAQLITNELRA
jgi:hypothetical protein